MSKSNRDTWTLEQIHGGWKLVIRPGISWKWMIPHTVAEWLAFAICVSLACLAFPEELLNGRAWNMNQILGSILLLFFILMTYLAAVWWIYLPPTVRQVLNARKPTEITFQAGSFECTEGVFQTSCLATLRLQPVKRLDRFALVFDGAAVKDAQLVGWPGLTENTALEVLATVTARYNTGHS